MILNGDALAVLRGMEAESVQTCVTSPPYWGLRDYGVAGQLGLEKTPEEYTAKLVAIFAEVRRVLRKDGTAWVNLGDSYIANGSKQVPQTKAHLGSGYAGPNRNEQTGLKPKDLVGIPWRVAFALQADGWYLRSDIIWHKPNPMPESVTDRPTKAHEYVFLLSKSAKYFYDADAIAEPAVFVGATRHLYIDNASVFARPDNGSRARTGKPQASTRNKRTVWTVCPKPYKGAHFATFPEKLIEPCILAGAPLGGVVLDPFSGAGTTVMVARRLGRVGLGIELNPAYIALTEARLAA